MSDLLEQSAKTAPVYVVVGGKMLLDATAEQAWPHVLDYKSWQTYSISEPISGTPGAEGEVVRLKKDEPGASATAYYARTIRIEPDRRLIWKTFRDHSGYFGIVDFRLRPAPEGCMFSWNCVYEYEVPYENEGELAEFQRRQTEAFELSGSVIYPKLKKLVESNARRA